MRQRAGAPQEGGVSRSAIAPPRFVSGLLALTLPALLALAACSGQPKPKAYDPLAEMSEVEEALAHYSDLILHMDAAGLAHSFVDDGETVDGDQPPIRGTEAIQARLETFKDYHVQENKLHADETKVHRDAAHQTGTFWQRVQIPDGSVVVAQGTFEADWVRIAPGTWKLKRMATVAQPVAPSP